MNSLARALTNRALACRQIARREGRSAILYRAHPIGVALAVWRRGHDRTCLAPLFEKRRKPGAGANPPGVSAREAYPPTRIVQRLAGLRNMTREQERDPGPSFLNRLVCAMPTLALARNWARRMPSSPSRRGRFLRRFYGPSTTPRAASASPKPPIAPARPSLRPSRRWRTRGSSHGSSGSSG